MSKNITYYYIINIYIMFISLNSRQLRPVEFATRCHVNEGTYYTGDTSIY